MEGQIINESFTRLSGANLEEYTGSGYSEA